MINKLIAELIQYAINNGLITEPGDTTHYINQSLEIMNLPNIDLNDPEQVSERLNTYFGICAKYDLKPTVSGLALSLNGKDRRWLWAVANDKPYGGCAVHIDADSLDSIKKAYHIMGTLWENYMQQGKINPVTGIFLGKNNFGYVDKTETVITPNTSLATSDSATIEAKYKELPLETDSD